MGSFTSKYRSVGSSFISYQVETTLCHDITTYNISWQLNSNWVWYFSIGLARCIITFLEA